MGKSGGESRAEDVESENATSGGDRKPPSE
jgi:hypothetical protein